MPEDITTLSIILLVCTIAIALSNALTAYAIYWERKQKNAPPYLGFLISGKEVNRPKFIVENPSELLYQVVRIRFSENLAIQDVETQNHESNLSSDNRILSIRKLKPGDSVFGYLDINIPDKAKYFFVEFAISRSPGEKIVVRGKGLFHYFKKPDTNEIFYVWNRTLLKLTFISKFKHYMNLCHCRKYLEDYYACKFQPIDSSHLLKDAPLRTK